MPPENVRRRKQEKRYSFVFVPSEEGSRTRTFSLTRWGIAAASITAAAVFIALILVVLIYTPVGKLLPIAHPELEYVYGKQLVDIEKQLSSLLDEMTTLKAYNISLRKALGENVSTADSAFVARQQDHYMNAVPGSNGAPGPGNESAIAEGEFERQLKSSLKDSASGNAGVSMAGFSVERPVSPISSDLPFGSPAHGYFTQSFDNEKKHLGIDISGKEGSPVFAGEDPFRFTRCSDMDILRGNDLADDLAVDAQTARCADLPFEGRSCTDDVKFVYFIFGSHRLFLYSRVNR